MLFQSGEIFLVDNSPFVKRGIKGDFSRKKDIKSPRLRNKHASRVSAVFAFVT
jgi:hypothetical protein